jgi:predicted methyltransferase
MRLYRPVLAALILGLSLASASAQEQSVKPGINENFQDPDVDRYIQMFEGESREIFAFRHEIVAALGLEPGMDVADVGAGTGFFAMMMSGHVEPGGTIHAVDIAENFIQHIRQSAEKHGVDNIEAHVCTERSVELPENSVDLVFVCDTYHHFEYPFDTLASIHRALRPGGQLVIVDFERIRGVSDEWVLDHVRCGKGTVADEIRDSGFDFVEEIDLGMEGQYVLRFRKREPVS